MARVLEGSDFGSTSPTPKFDPQTHCEMLSDAIQGRRIEDFRQVLEAQGFRFIPAKALPRTSDGQRPKEGQWRNSRMGFGFTDSDVLGMFPKGPEEFHTWMEDQRLRRRMAALGLVLSR